MDEGGGGQVKMRLAIAGIQFEGEHWEQTVAKAKKEATRVALEALKIMYGDAPVRKTVSTSPTDKNEVKTALKTRSRGEAGNASNTSTERTRETYSDGCGRGSDVNARSNSVESGSKRQKGNEERVPVRDHESEYACRGPLEPEPVHIRITNGVVDHVNYKSIIAALMPSYPNLPEPERLAIKRGVRLFLEHELPKDAFSDCITSCVAHAGKHRTYGVPSSVRDGFEAWLIEELRRCFPDARFTVSA
ncbi:hypothetical protein BC830DRAFT_760543 [Chytriomyces sp. MP71]|nr:hypothetical protein BC830DRAFT_760543 [Chytriomyces sp. MP71]